MRRRRTRITDLFPEAAEDYEENGEPFNAIPLVFVIAATVLALVIIIDFIALF